MGRPQSASEEAAVLRDIARVRRLLPQAKFLAVHATNREKQARALEAVKTLERSLEILLRRQSQLRGTAPVPRSAAATVKRGVESSPALKSKAAKAKPAGKTARCPVCTQTVPTSKSGRLLIHRLSSGPKCSEGVALHVEKRPKVKAKPDKFTRQTAWAMQHASSAGLPGLGKRN